MLGDVEDVVKTKTKVSDPISRSSIKYVIKKKSAEELEIEIQTNRVLYVLNETVQKIKIAALLGYLTQCKGKLLRKYVSKSDANFVVSSCEAYLETVQKDDEKGSNASTIDTASKIVDRTVLMRDQSDVNLMQSIDLLFSCEPLMEHIKDLDLKMDYLSKSLIEGMIELASAAKEKLSTTAAQERESAKLLKAAWKENLEAQQIIDGLEEKLSKQNEELREQLSTRDGLINMYKQKIHDAKTKFQEEIKKKVLKSEKTMIKESAISDAKQQELSKQSKEAVQTYNQLLEQHLAAEKVMRAKRYKTEAQLGSWIEKYDKDIGDRQLELEELQLQYDTEKTELDALQAKFDEQEEEYLELMGEKNAKLQADFNRRYYDFIMNRAARIIQRCWRAYLVRKKSRKRGKGKKKGAKKGAAKKTKKPEPKVQPSAPSEADLEKLMFGDSMIAVDEGEEGEEGEGEEAKKPKSKKGKRTKKPKKDKKGLARDDDPNAVLKGTSSKFAEHVFEEISEEPIPSGPVKVDLSTTTADK